jgi:hypothetical protein
MMGVSMMSVSMMSVSMMSVIGMLKVDAHSRDNLSLKQQLLLNS